MGALPNAQVVIFVNGVQREEVDADASGAWQYTFLPALNAMMAHTITVCPVGVGVESSDCATRTIPAVTSRGGTTETPVLSTEDDDDNADAAANNRITFLPATFGGIDLGDDAAATSPITATPANNDDDTGVLGAEDVRADWSVVNAALAGFIAILSVVALAGIRRGQADNNTGARIFTLVPATAAVIAFFVIEGVSGSMIWFNVWTWLFAGILVVQAIVATLTTRTAND